MSNEFPIRGVKEDRYGNTGFFQAKYEGFCRQCGFSFEKGIRFTTLTANSLTKPATNVIREIDLQIQMQALQNASRVMWLEENANPNSADRVSRNTMERVSRW